MGLLATGRHQLDDSDAPTHRVTRTASPALLIVGLGLVLAVLLAVPGRTVTTRLLEELFVALDGAHRVLSGQVPSRDFHTPLGPLAYYLPALGYRLAGSFGGAMPMAMALLLAVFAPVCAHVLGSRLRPVLALIFATFLLLVLAVPMRLGEGVTSLSFAGFYDRVGWVALSTLLVMHIEPRRGTSRLLALDVLCATLLTLLMLYMRPTYGLVGLAFLCLVLFQGGQRRWAALALILVALAGGLLELAWGGTANYVADARMALEAAGFLRGSWNQVLEQLLGNFADFLLLAVIAGIALWRGRRLRDAVFFLFCAAAGFWLINHNVQRWGILAVHAAAVVAAERILRAVDEAPNRTPATWINAAGVQLYVLGFVLPTIVHCALAFGLHAVTAAAGAGQPLPLPRMGEVRLADLWTGGDFGGSMWFLGTLEDGLRSIEAAGDGRERIFVVGGSNPFAAALDLPPPRGDAPQLRWEDTIDDTHHPAPEAVFAEVDLVLEWKSAGGSGPVGALYMPYVTTHFEPAGESEHWRLFRRAAGSPPAAQDPAPAAPPAES